VIAGSGAESTAQVGPDPDEVQGEDGEQSQEQALEPLRVEVLEEPLSGEGAEDDRADHPAQQRGLAQIIEAEGEEGGDLQDVAQCLAHGLGGDDLLFLQVVAQKEGRYEGPGGTDDHRQEAGGEAERRIDPERGAT